MLIGHIFKSVRKEIFENFDEGGLHNYIIHFQIIRKPLRMLNYHASKQISHLSVG
jgi:hypothetical protein